MTVDHSWLCCGECQAHCEHAGDAQCVSVFVHASLWWLTGENSESLLGEVIFPRLRCSCTRAVCASLHQEVKTRRCSHHHSLLLAFVLLSRGIDLCWNDFDGTVPATLLDRTFLYVGFWASSVCVCR